MINMGAEKLLEMSAWLLFIALFPVEGAIINGTIKDNTFRIMYLIPWTEEWNVGPDIGSAIQVAINEVKSQQILQGYDVNFTLGDTRCKSQHGVTQALDMWEQMEDVDVVLGDGCSVVCEPTALLSSVWNVPQVSYGCTAAALSDKDVYETFVRTVGPWNLLAPMFDQIANLWGHTRIGIIADSSDLMRNTAEHVKKHLASNGKTVFYRVIESTAAGSTTIMYNYKLLKEWVAYLKERCRAIFIITYGNDVRNTLIAAHELEMLNGDYLFTSLEVTPTVLSPPRKGWLYPHLGSELFNGLLIGNPVKRSGPAYDQFRQDVIDAFQDPVWDGLPHLASDASIEKVLNYAALVYDSVLLWAHGVNRTFAKGEQPDDGRQVALSMFDVEFEGMSGNVHLNSEGDRLLEFTIDIPQNGAIVTIAKWLAKEKRIEKMYKPSSSNDWDGLIWGRGVTTPPKSHPPCGWDYEICLPQKLGLGAAIFFGAFLFFGIVAVCAFYVSRFCRFKKKLQSASDSCLKWESVEPVRDFTGPGKNIIKKINQSGSQQTQVVKFDGEFAVLRKLGALNVDVEEFDARLELKYMRDVASKNLCPFLGIVPSNPNACILMGFASRGSVQDLIDDENIVLNWDLKVSLTNDICNGLLYIHSSPLRFHGHFTSANCVVDSRLLCKITDYGFHRVRSQANIELDKEEFTMRKLWFAPELLRGGCQPSVETDIYAFGIISQEILLEGLPYCENDDELTPLQIIKNVEDFDINPPYRPFIPDDVSGYDWRMMVKSCWKDNPLERPSMKNVRTMITAIAGGKPLNIDNQIHVMYKHNRTVEKKVDSKCESLENERNRLNVLLMELVPKSVSAELKLTGKNVPEVYDCVTICFAYNVDFTATCVQWSPHEIVSTLNRMYGVLDEVMSSFDVYKVATVGDSLMVASGLPNRNGTKHAEEICGMADRFQNVISRLQFPHMPGKCMRLRCGVHTGSVIAGVAGVKVPRYLLFGNTVDFAAKMETSGDPGKIHLSQTTHQLLDKSVFKLDHRWEMELRGFGRMNTYWLSKVNWEKW